MNKEILQRLINEGKSSYQIAKEVGKGQTTVVYWIKKLELTKLYKAVSNYKLSEDFRDIEFVKQVIASSKSYNEVFIKLKRNSSSSSYRTLKKFIERHKINISHFLSKRDMAKKLHKEGKLNKLCNSEIFIENSTCSRASVKNRVLEEGLLEYKCSKCGQDDNWNGEKITLILDHINGIRNDNRLENLRILCPNCNATLDTHCKGNITSYSSTDKE